jgi:CRP-like cAMP-binding protein
LLNLLKKSGASPTPEQPKLSHKEHKVIMDAFNLFDTDGDGSVTREELKHVMETLFNTALSDEEIEGMVTEADSDGDGEVSFEEFESKVAAMIKGFEGSEEGKEEEKDAGHWSSLSRLISHFSEIDEANEPSIKQAQTKKVLSHLNLPSLQSKDSKQQAKEQKKAWNQHDAMVAHFNLRRLSIGDAGGGNKEDDMQAAMRAIAERESRLLRNRFRRPMNPHSDFRRGWELVVLILVLFQALYIPFTVAFSVNWAKGSSMWIFDLVTDGIFMFDLLMTFNVGVVDSSTNELVLDRKVIAKQYLKSWFLLDLAASVPFDFIIESIEESQNDGTDGENDSNDNNAASAASLLKGFKLPRLLRLLKVMRIMRLVKLAKIRPEVIWWFQYSRHSNLLRLFTLVLIILTGVHYMTCMFFVVMSTVWLSREDCEAYNLEDYRYDSNIHDTLGLDTDYHELPLHSCGNLTDSYVTLSTQYITSFYSSMLLIQGEHIVPKSPQEKLYCSLLILLGSLVLAYVFGNVSMYIANFSANTTAYQRKMEYLFESMNHLELPQNLKKRIIMYYAHIWKEYRSLDGSIHAFIPELSKQLSSEVFLYLRTNLILSVPFLRMCSPEVVQRLVVTLQTEVFLPNDYIVHKGVPGEEMYLISRGTCEVTITDFVSENSIDNKVNTANESSESDMDSSGRRKEGSRRGAVKGGKGKRRKSVVEAMNNKIQHLVSKSFVNPDGFGADAPGGYDADGNALNRVERKKRETMEKKGLSGLQRDVTNMPVNVKSYASTPAEIRTAEGRRKSSALAVTAKDQLALIKMASSNKMNEIVEEEGSVSPASSSKQAAARQPSAAGGSSMNIGVKKDVSNLSINIPGEVDSSGDGDGDGYGDESSPVSRSTPTPSSERRRSRPNLEGSQTKPQTPNALRDIIKTEKVVKELHEGDFFGEIALILNTTRTCNVRAKTFAELNILRREDFEEIVGKYEDERNLMEEIIMEKYKVEIPDMESQRRNTKVNTPAEQSQQLQATHDFSQETRLVVDVMAAQIKLLTDALIEARVINHKSNSGMSNIVGERAGVLDNAWEGMGGRAGGPESSFRKSKESRPKERKSSFAVKNKNSDVPALERIISPKQSPRRIASFRNVSGMSLMSGNSKPAPAESGFPSAGMAASSPERNATQAADMNRQGSQHRKRQSSARGPMLADLIEESGTNGRGEKNSADGQLVVDASIKAEAVMKQEAEANTEEREEAEDAALAAFRREHGMVQTRVSYSGTKDYTADLNERVLRNTRKQSPSLGVSAQETVNEMRQEAVKLMSLDVAKSQVDGMEIVTGSSSPSPNRRKEEEEKKEGGKFKEGGGGGDDEDADTNTSTPSKDDVTALLDFEALRSKETSLRSISAGGSPFGEPSDGGDYGVADQRVAIVGKEGGEQHDHEFDDLVSSIGMDV